MNLHTLYHGWFYESEGTRGKFYYPVDLLEMPVNLGDKLIRWIEYPGIDVDKALDQLAELMKCKFLSMVVVNSGNLIFDGITYKRTNLKNPQKKVDAHNAAVRNHHANRLAIEADRAKATFLGHGSGKDFIGMGVKPGWFVQLSSCSVWCEVVNVGGSYMDVMDRYQKRGKTGTAYEGYSVTAIRPDAPAFGHFIRADGTANYYDKHYPRVVRK